MNWGYVASPFTAALSLTAVRNDRPSITIANPSIPNAQTAPVERLGVTDLSAALWSVNSDPRENRTSATTKDQKYRSRP